MFCFLTFSKQTVQRQPSCPRLVAAGQAGAGLLLVHHKAALWAGPSMLFLVHPTLLSCCAPGLPLLPPDVCTPLLPLRPQLGG